HRGTYHRRRTAPSHGQLRPQRRRDRHRHHGDHITDGHSSSRKGSPASHSRPRRCDHAAIPRPTRTGSRQPPSRVGAQRTPRRAMTTIARPAIGDIVGWKLRHRRRIPSCMSDWHFLVDRDDYRTTRVVQFAPAPLHEVEVRLRVHAFGFTANNITYAAAGDMIGYWTFFPAPSTGDAVNWGRVPVWGFADVVESRCDGVDEGERLFGYLPMSTELVIAPTHLSTGSLT